MSMQWCVGQLKKEPIWLTFLLKGWRRAEYANMTSYRVFKKNTLQCLFVNLCKFWIQNQFFAILGGWDIYKTNGRSRIDKYIFIHTWSSPHSTRVALRWPNWPSHILRGPQGPLVAPIGLSGGVQATHGPVGASQAHSEPVRTTSGQYEYVLVYSGTQLCFANILAP